MSGGLDSSWITWGRMLLVAMGAIVAVLALSDFRRGRSGMAALLLVFGLVAAALGATDLVFPGRLF
ncbi:MAG: hypothetical protein ACM3ZA_11540 [Bacillota bacterium]